MRQRMVTPASPRAIAWHGTGPWRFGVALLCWRWRQRLARSACVRVPRGCIQHRTTRARRARLARSTRAGGANARIIINNCVFNILGAAQRSSRAACAAMGLTTPRGISARALLAATLWATPRRACLPAWAALALRFAQPPHTYCTPAAPRALPAPPLPLHYTTTTAPFLRIPHTQLHGLFTPFLHTRTLHARAHYIHTFTCLYGGVCIVTGSNLDWRIWLCYIINIRGGGRIRFLAGVSGVAGMAALWRVNVRSVWHACAVVVTRARCLPRVRTDPLPRTRYHLPGLHAAHITHWLFYAFVPFTHSLCRFLPAPFTHGSGASMVNAGWTRRGSGGCDYGLLYGCPPAAFTPLCITHTATCLYAPAAALHTAAYARTHTRRRLRTHTGLCRFYHAARYRACTPAYTRCRALLLPAHTPARRCAAAPHARRALLPFCVRSAAALGPAAHAAARALLHRRTLPRTRILPPYRHAHTHAGSTLPPYRRCHCLQHRTPLPSW